MKKKRRSKQAILSNACNCWGKIMKILYNQRKKNHFYILSVPFFCFVVVVVVVVVCVCVCVCVC
jgi:hypothetical protein